MQQTRSTAAAISMISLMTHPPLARLTVEHSTEGRPTIASMAAQSLHEF
jgi:hypothetical protein